MSREDIVKEGMHKIVSDRLYNRGTRPGTNNKEISKRLKEKSAKYESSNITGEW